MILFLTLDLCSLLQFLVAAGRFAFLLLAMQLLWHNSDGVVYAVSVDHLAEVGSSNTGDVEGKVSAKRLSIFGLNKFCQLC